MVEVSNLLTIFKYHAIALPVETVCEDDFSSGSFRNIVDAVFRRDFVANTQTDLALVWVGECVWLPNRHCTILTDWNHFHANPWRTKRPDVPHDWRNSPADTLHSL